MLRVADDGIGIRPEQLDKRAEGHLGLRLLIDRMADQGGELRIEARPEGGTVALARMPVDGPLEPAASTAASTAASHRPLRRHVPAARPVEAPESRHPPTRGEPHPHVRLPPAARRAQTDSRGGTRVRPARAASTQEPRDEHRREPEPDGHPGSLHGA